jgi:hypothetical protein
MGLGMSVAGCLALGAAQIDRSTPWPAQLPQSKLHSIALVLLAGGAWAMSAVASGEALIPAASRRRNRMRWLFAIALAVRLFDWLLAGVGSFRLSIDYSRVATWGIYFCGALGIGLQLYIIEEFTERPTDQSLSKWARIVAWSVPVTVGLFAIVEVGTVYSRTARVWLIGFLPFSALLGAWRVSVFLYGASWIASGVILAWMFKVVHQRMKSVGPRTDRNTVEPIADDGEGGGDRESVGAGVNLDIADNGGATGVDDGTVDSDVHCRHCGYNLRSLRRNGRCPECGEAVGLSLRRDWLQYANLNWLWSVYFGMGLLVIGCFAFSAQAFFQFLPESARSLTLILFYASQLLIATGAWVLTGEPDRKVSLNRPIRLAIRWLAVAALAGAAAFLLIDTFRMVRVTYVMGIVTSVIEISVQAAEMSAVCCYLRVLALRMPHLRLAKSANILIWGIPTADGLYAFFFILLPMFLWGASPRPHYDSLYWPTLVGLCRVASFLSAVAWLTGGFLCGWMLLAVARQIDRAKGHAARWSGRRSGAVDSLAEPGTCNANASRANRPSGEGS